VRGDSNRDTSDLSYHIDFIFGGGPAPSDCRAQLNQKIID
jgi:hypothetical protein